VTVTNSRGKAVPIQLRGDKLSPAKTLPAGAQVTVEVTVRRPGWAGWLVGHSSSKTFQLTTPTAGLRGRWLEIPDGRPVTVSFDAPVRVVQLRDGRGTRLLRFPTARATVRTGVIATGATQAGTVTVRS